MRLYLLIALGGALGSVLRFFINGLIAPQVSDVDGWIPILVINVTGSFLIGLIFALTGPDGRWFASSATRLFLMTGICGGYTTFSSFSLQTLNLVRDGYVLRAGANVAGSVVLCLLGVWLGHVAGALLNQSR
ncbi:MAG TPA: fluoride efflux transporter CrcB [Opitutaceae bacterium]|jgi:CrcB protein|nr:fluoride efflux transporter CrcB [Opitutaceae bacterium]